MKIIYVSSCLLKKSNKVLITSRPKGKFLSGFWELPGGKLFNNESFEDCAVRELYEEIGVNINKEDFLITKILLETSDIQYYPLVETLSRFDFFPSFNSYFIAKKIITFPFLSIIWHAILFKFFGYYSFIILEFFFKFLVFVVLYKIFKKFVIIFINSIKNHLTSW